jgi:hypothetical protein
MASFHSLAKVREKVGGQFMTVKVLTIVALLILLITSPLFAANICVGPSAAGNGSGSDWSNQAQWSTLTFARGNTYYLSDGTYEGRTLSTAASSTSLITIKKAIAADHVTDTGWSSTMGDGVATFGQMVFSTSYWTFDGQVGGGPTAWNSGHGFAVYSTAGVLVTLSGTVSNITISHTKIYSDRTAIVAAGIKGTTGACDSITVHYCELSNIFGTPFHWKAWTNSTIEYSYIYYNKSTADYHTEGISSIGTNENIVIRWNLWDRIDGTAVFAGVNSGASINWQIYGNIFSRSQSTIYYYWEAGTSSNKNSMTNSEFFNNTIVGVPNVSQGGLVIDSGSGNTAYNNIFYGNIANSFEINATHDYTYVDSNTRTDGCSPYCDMDSSVVTGEVHGTANAGNPFVRYNADPLQADLRTTSTLSGYNTSALVAGNNTDMLGNTRTNWTRGALEYGAGSGLSAPRNVRIAN